MKILPKVFDTPAFKGTEYDTATLPLSIRKYWVDQKKEISEISEKLMKLFPELQYDKILWAWHVTNTRCIFVENEEHDNVDNSDGDTIAVIPFVDMLNHDPIKFQGVALHEKLNGRYVVQAKRQIMGGEQVFVCYGPHDNTRLLVEYGFTLPENLNTKVLIPQEVLITLAKIAGIEVTKEHERVLTEVGLPSHLYATDEGPSWSLKNNVRVMLLEHWQMANGRWKKIIYSHDPIEDDVAAKIDEKLKIMLKELREGVAEKTKKMPSEVQWMWEEQVKVCDAAIAHFDKNVE
uniref:SET domain-containing protein n=1 Tax=Caenorhabditis japonica TaxID=281687 RepID=A0A8R1I267_CAEJA